MCETHSQEAIQATPRRPSATLGHQQRVGGVLAAEQEHAPNEAYRAEEPADGSRRKAWRRWPRASRIPSPPRRPRPLTEDGAPCAPGPGPAGASPSARSQGEKAHVPGEPVSLVSAHHGSCTSLGGRLASDGWSPPLSVFLRLIRSSSSPARSKAEAGTGSSGERPLLLRGFSLRPASPIPRIPRAERRPPAPIHRSAWKVFSEVGSSIPQTRSYRPRNPSQDPP